jgi:hypothetical protein
LAYAQGTAIVSVSAPSQVDTGETFTISIDVDPNTAIAGVQFDLTFDSSLVTASNVVEGDLLTQGGAITYFTPGSTDNGTGTISGVAGVIISPGQTVSTAGTFAAITLTAGTGGGTSPLTLSNVVVGDIGGSSVPVNVVNDNVTIDSLNPPPPPGGGGGGGGGGGAPPTPTAAVSFTDLSLITTSTGVTTADVTATSEDGKVELTIDRGTTAKTSDDEAIAAITVAEMLDPPAPPEDSTVIGLTYDLGPDGATFDPPITLTFTYSPDDIPEDVNEEDLVIAMWDEDTGEWTVLEGATVDPVNHTITAPVSHFTAFAVVAYTRPATLETPATFSVSVLKITPEVVYIGEEVTITAPVTNTGDTAGNYKVTLKINNAVVDSKDVIDLASGASQNVTFAAAMQGAGTFTVDVNGVTGSFIVSQVPIPKITGFSIAPTYDAESNRLASARINYQVNNPYEPMSNVRLILKVSVNGEPVEEVALFSRSQLGVGITADSRDYVPSQGWESGTYAFQAELYADGKSYSSTTEDELEVMAESAVPVQQWAVLAAIIVAIMVLIPVTLVILRRRRRLLYGYTYSSKYRINRSQQSTDD